MTGTRSTSVRQPEWKPLYSMVQITVDGEGDEGVLKKVGPKTPRPKEGQSRVQVLENGGRFRCPVDLGAGKGHSTCDTKERTVSKSGDFFPK